MRGLALVLAVTASAAVADGTGWNLDRMALLPGDGACFAYVEIENRAGMYNRTETLETAEGPVSIEYTTIGGHNPDNPDRVAVSALPDHVIAVPMEMGIADGDTDTICLRQWMGG